MNTAASSLLPSGFFDLLPPDARQQRLLYQQTLECFTRYGYREVSPPLMEFETSLLAEKSSALAAQTFRLMDPLSREMMGIRTDMTMQVARIATARLSDQPRPLRLCYAGTCLRVTGEGLRRERQFMQAGAELIGSESIAAEIEILRMAVEAIAPLGLGEITIDLTLPGLSESLLATLPEALQTPCRDALHHKDRSGLAQHDHPLIPTLISLLDVTSSTRLTALLTANIPTEAAALIAGWRERIEQIEQAGIAARITLDPLEHHGFEYYHAIAFSIFASRVESEIGRGGRYLLNDETPAVGFTLYLNPLRYVMNRMPEATRCYIPYGTAIEAVQALQQQDYITVHALTPEADAQAAARSHGCSHIWHENSVCHLSSVSL